jgi:predicted nucleotidyltransferase
MVAPAFQPPEPEHIRSFCERWKVRELSVFGSVLTGRAAASSDVDVLVTLASDVERDWDLWPAMQADLEAIFGRRVDLVERERLSNPFRRYEILRTRRVLYAA